MSLGGEYYFDYDCEYCDSIGMQGLIYIGKTGLIVGYNDSVNRSKSYGSAGIIMDSNTNGEFYTLSVLCENGAVVEYDVDTSVSINGYDYTYDEQTQYFNIGKYNGAEYIYGYINNISGNVLSVAGRDFMITPETLCYHYNDEGARVKLEVGNWNTEFVDIYDSDDGTATPVYIKLYDGKVTDIVTFSGRVDVNDINWCVTTHSDGE